MSTVKRVGLLVLVGALLCLTYLVGRLVVQPHPAAELAAEREGATLVYLLNGKYVNATATDDQFCYNGFLWKEDAFLGLVHIPFEHEDGSLYSCEYVQVPFTDLSSHKDLEA